MFLEPGVEVDAVRPNVDVALAREIAMQVAAMNPENTEDLLGQPSIKDESKTIRNMLDEAVQKFGERIEVSHFARLSTR